MAKLIKKYLKYTLILKYLSSVYNHVVTHVDDLFIHDEKNNLISFSAENPVLTKYKINLIVDNHKLKGLTGNQGVLIPAVNIKNLMLREDIVKAAKLKNFNLSD